MEGRLYLIALAGLFLIATGYGEARPDSSFIYSPPAGMKHLAALLMLPVFPLLIATYFPGRISAWVKHLMLVAVKFWAVAHLLSNGRLVELLLFGTFLFWAVWVRFSYRQRGIRPLPGLPRSNLNDWIALIVGAGLYGLFAAHLHRVLSGVSPMG